MPSAEEITEMYRKIEQNEKEMKRFEADLKKLISGDKKLASSPLLVGKTPASLAICGADGTLNMTITKKVIDKIMSPEIRDSNGQRTKKSGHFLSESQLVNALENLKNPVMVLKGSRDNSLVAITDIQDDKGQQVLVSISLSDNGSVDDVNRITSAYGREGFADYMKQQINQHKNVLAYNKEKANDLLLSIEVDFPEANTIISFDDSIAYTTANVKYPNQESERDQPQEKLLTAKETAQKITNINNPVLSSKAKKRQMKISKLEDKNTVLFNKNAKNEVKIEKQQAKIEDAQKTKAYCKTLLESAALPQPLQVFFQSMMDRQESKISKFNEKIDNIKIKNKNLTDKININNKKIEKNAAKIETLQNVDKFLTNMQSKEGRRENFIQAISDLRNSSLKRNNKKSLKLNAKIAQKKATLTSTISSVERVQLRNKIAKLQNKLNSVNEKISKLTAMNLDKLNTLSNQQVDKIIENAANGINNNIDANQNMNEQMIVDTVINEAGKAITNNEIDNRTTPQNEEKSIIEKLNGEINDDILFFGELTYETAQHIKEAGYEFKDNNLQKASPEQNSEHQDISQQEDEIKQNENRADKQAEKTLDVNALCAAIPLAFAENYDMQTKLLHTAAVFSALAENFNFDDVKSAVAIGIMDKKEDRTISDKAKKWANNLSLTNTLKTFVNQKGSLPLDLKSAYLDIFAKKADSWEKSCQEKSPIVISRKDIIDSKPKKLENQPKTQQQDKSISTKKNKPSR